MYSVRALNVISERVANVLGTFLFNYIRSALPMYSERVVNTPKTFGARCESIETVGMAYATSNGYLANGSYLLDMSNSLVI